MPAVDYQIALWRRRAIAERVDASIRNLLLLAQPNRASIRHRYFIR